VQITKSDFFEKVLLTKGNLGDIIIRLAKNVGLYHDEKKLKKISKNA